MATQVEGARQGLIGLEIVTPKGTALKVDVDEVTAPSVEGEFGVLPGHLPLLVALQTGLVTYRQGAEVKKCAVGRGFAEAGPDRMVILTDRYVEREQIDPVLVRRDLAEVQQKIARTLAAAVEPTRENIELDVLIPEENWLAAELELYGDPPPAIQRPFERFGPVSGPDEEDVPTDTTDATDTVQPKA
jgi:F-type H+-transporting ATPase subunit epsilon